MSTNPASAALLARQLKQMQTDKDIPGISCGLVDGNVYEWEVMLMISDECKFYGGEYTIELPLSFPPQSNACARIVHYCGKSTRPRSCPVYLCTAPRQDGN